MTDLAPPFLPYPGSEASNDARYVNVDEVPAHHFGTSPPPTPTDGDQWLYPLDHDRMWLFEYRYIATSSTPWKFVGGPIARADVATGQSTTTTNTWLDLATVGPSWVVPLTGYYSFQSSARASHSATNALVWIALYNIRTGVGNGYSIVTALAGNGYPFPTSPVLATGANAGDEYRLRYHNTSPGTATWSDRWLTVTPIAVAA